MHSNGIVRHAYNYTYARGYRYDLPLMHAGAYLRTVPERSARLPAVTLGFTCLVAFSHTSVLLCAQKSSTYSVQLPLHLNACVSPAPVVGTTGRTSPVLPFY